MFVIEGRKQVTLSNLLSLKNIYFILSVIKDCSFDTNDSELRWIFSQKVLNDLSLFSVIKNDTEFERLISCRNLAEEIINDFPIKVIDGNYISDWKLYYSAMIQNCSFKIDPNGDNFQNISFPEPLCVLLPKVINTEKYPLKNNSEATSICTPKTSFIGWNVLFYAASKTTFAQAKKLAMAVVALGYKTQTTQHFATTFGLNEKQKLSITPKDRSNANESFTTMGNFVETKTDKSTTKLSKQGLENLVVKKIPSSNESKTETTAIEKERKPITSTITTSPTMASLNTKVSSSTITATTTTTTHCCCMLPPFGAPQKWSIPLKFAFCVSLAKMTKQEILLCATTLKTLLAESASFRMKVSFIFFISFFLSPFFLLSIESFKKLFFIFFLNRVCYVYIYIFYM